MAQEGSSKKLYPLVAIVLILAGALIALIIFYQKTTKPPVNIEADIPAGIKHIKSIYGPAAGDNFNRPESAGIDKDGNIYVADTGNHRIVEFDSNGNYKRSIGEKKIRFPLGVSVSKAGNIYVTSLMEHKLYIFSSKGSLRKSIKFNKKEETPIKVLVYKNKLYLTAIGQIMVSDMNGKVEKRWGGKEGRALGKYMYPNGIVVGKLGKFGESIIISDSENNRLQVLSMSGKARAYMGQPPTSLKDESLLFGLPMGVTLDGDGRIFVVDSFNNSIRIFDKEGNDLGELGKRGSADGRFYYPTDIKHIGGNRFLVTDKWNDRIQIVALTVREAKAVSKPKKK